jgi:23S rRNA (adenine2503-C2)-methyltransferase
MLQNPNKNEDQPNLYGLDREQLAEFLEPFSAPRYHADQIYRWLYSRRELDPSAWTDLPRALREKIATAAVVQPGELADPVSADDGTVKYRINLPGRGSVEAVYMIQSDRVTLCISSQVGCALGCDFCLTAKMGFIRHLTPGEIVGQVARIQAAHGLQDRPFSIVYMGMGEPLHNYDGVVRSIRLLTDPDGFGISRQRITVSTSGLAPAIEKLADEPTRPRLAVSLNATTDELRDRIMPVNRRYPIKRLVEACGVYARTSRKRFTFEYVLLAGVNDSPEDVRRLAGIVRGLPAKVNLIPFNAVPGLLDYQAPRRDQIIAFRDNLDSMKIPVTIRWSRGAEARAACGQLALL